jgi:hypothetical protein
MQVVQAIRFGNPMFEVAFLSLHVHINERVGIDEREFRYRSLHDSQLLRLKRPLPVMGRQRARHDEQRKSRAK